MESVKFSDIIKQNYQNKELYKNENPYKIKILSNITCNQFSEILSYYLYSENLNPYVNIGNFDNIVQESFFCSEYDLVIIHYELVSIINKHNLFVENIGEDEIDLLINNIKADISSILSNLTNVPLVIFNTFSTEGIFLNTLLPSKSERIADSLNSYLYSLQINNLHIYNTKKIISTVGINSSFDYRMYYISKSLFSIDFWKEYSNNIIPLILKNTGKIKKAIIFDCDNTLWKGVLGEDGAKGIDMSPHSKIGQIYCYIQKIAVWLSSRGVIIGLCSKNNKKDVDEIFNNHQDIILKEEQIVTSRINWNDKASNLIEIAEELNIGLDSFIFIDDSLFEINLIKEHLPMVTTFQVPEAIHEYPQRLLSLVNRYFYFSGSFSDIEKTNQYKTQKLRSEAISKFNSIEEYLSSIGIELSFKSNDISEIERISQLTQKTNQFNLTTKRYTEGQIENMMNNSTINVYSVKVKDNFGDSGLTAVCIVKYSDNIATIDTFLMSCRIMGRNIEYAIIDVIIKNCVRMKFSLIRAMYIKSHKNSPVFDLYEKFGFTLVSDANGDKLYEIETKNYKYNNINYIKIKI